MPKKDNLADLLRSAAPFCKSQGEFLDAAKKAYAEVWNVRPGVRPKQDIDTIFNAVREFRRTYYEKKKKLPTKYCVGKFINTQFGYSLNYGKTLVGIYTRWHLKGCIKLTTRGCNVISQLSGNPSCNAQGF